MVNERHPLTSSCHRHAISKDRTSDRAVFRAGKGRCARAFTLLELLIVITIVALLATISVPTYAGLRRKAQKVVCISYLRNLHTALNSFMIEHSGVWPQIPEELLGNEEQEWPWWNDVLKEHGMDQKYWTCPSDVSSIKSNKSAPSGHFTGSYIVTIFDDRPNIANKWNQPWAMERGGFHGDKEGPHLLMPDGAVKPGLAFPTPH